MSDKKNIDRIFQEKFKDFEVTPGDHLWEGIESRLKKKKKRRVIPVWWRYAGVAAVLILFFTLGLNVFDNSSNSDITPAKVVGTENKNSNTINKDQKEDSNNVRNNNGLINKNELSTSSDNNQIADSPNQEITPSDPYRTKKDYLEVDQNNNLANVNNKPDNKSSNALKNNIDKTNSKENSHLAENNLNPKSTEDSLLLNNSEIAENLKPDKNTSIENELDEKAETESLEENSLQSIEDAIAAVEETLEDNEDEKQKKRWSVSPNIAPVYYSSLGTGSHIDDQFVNNKKTGELNTSYGVTVAYQISNKLRLRSGVHDLSLSYDTDNVILIKNTISLNPSALARSSLQNVTLTNQSQNISALSINNLQAQDVPSLLPNNKAAISQRIGYLEVPLELQYDLIKKNFGLNLIGGFSTFILDKNEVVTEFDGRRNLIGEANNINDVSFSANFGVGIDYKFSEKFKFNFEPTFKYQINAFDNTFGDFKPYIFGVYTGFSFKF